MGAPAAGRRRCRNAASSTPRRRRRARLPTTAASSAAAAPSRIRPTTTSSIKVRPANDVAVRSRMEALRRLVDPSDAGVDVRDELLLLVRAAGYIARLQAQVRVMRLLVDVLQEHAAPQDM